MTNRSTAEGLGLTLASAVLLSGLGVTTQLAFEAGATVGTLLSGRFLVAAAILWSLVLVLRPRAPSRRQLAAGLLLGVGYSGHAWLFSAALGRLDAGLVDLLLFTYPALVMVGAVALRRERWSARSGLALGAAGGGSALVLVGNLHVVDAVGAVLAFASAVAYAAYILTSAGQLEQTHPVVLTALVTTGAAVVLTIAAAGQSDVALDAGTAAFALVTVVGLVATAGMTTFIAGIDRLGASRASIVSGVQPALTPVLGFLVFADRLRPQQIIGGALVVAAVAAAAGRSPESPARLPLRARRRLARMTGALEVPAGSRLVRQGTHADAFYVIEQGRATVERDDRRVADLGTGEFFGELALLRGGRRTASVTAATDMRVQVIPRRHFGDTLRELPALARAVRAASVTRLVPLRAEATAATAG